MFGIGASGGFGLYCLFHLFAGDCLLLEQVASTLGFASGLRQSCLGFAQSCLGLWTRRLLQLSERSFGVAHGRFHVIGTKHCQHVTSLHTVTFSHTPFDHHASHWAANLGT